MKKIICLTIISLTLLLGACVEKSVSTNKTSNTRDFIVYGINKPPKDLLFFDREDINNQDIIINLFEGLVKLDEAGKVIPAIAESFSVSKDESTYTFKIRSEATWSDGKDITADDFETFFKHILSKESNNIHAYKLYYIFGAEDYNKGRVDFDQVAIKAVDRNTLQIKLNQPCNYFINILAQPVFSLRSVDKSLLEYDKSYKNIAYTGEYKILDYSVEKGVTLEKNAAYWNSEQTRSNKILFAFTGTSEASLAKFETNQIDVFKNPPLKQLKSLEDKGYITKKPMLNCDVLVFNIKKGNELIKNKCVRQALAGAIDRNKIVSDAYSNTAKPAKAYVPAELYNMVSAGCQGTNYYSVISEREKGKNLLEKNKIGLQKKKIKLVFVEKTENMITADILSKEFKNSFGLDLICEGVKQEEIEGIKESGEYDIILAENYASYEYPTALLELWQTNNKANFIGFNNTQFDSYLYKIKIEKDPIKKIELVKKAEDILLQDAAIVPLYNKEIIICKVLNLEKSWIDKLGNLHLGKSFLFLKR